MKKIRFFSKNSLKSGLIGIINGLFGAGGGLALVPLLVKMGFERKAAHANAVAVIFSITIVSAAIYIAQGYVKLSDSFIFLPGGILGAITGTLVMKKISPKAIKKIFGIFMIWAGWRLVFG